MTWSGHEVEIARPPDPAATVVVGDYAITITGRSDVYEPTLIPGGSSYVILSLSSGEERVFTGIHNYRKNGWSLVAAAGRAWVFGGNSGLVGSPTMQGIDPIGGGIVAPGNRSTQNMSNPPVAAADYLFNPGAPTQRYDTVAGTWTGLTGLPSAWLFAIGNRLFTIDSSNNATVEVDPVTADVLNTWPGAPTGGAYHAVTGGRVHVLGSNAIGISTFDPAAGWTVTGYPPTGRPSLTARPIPDASGYLYQLVSDTQMAVTDPSTGRWAIRDLPVVRGRRGGMYFDGSNIRIPTGEPVN